MTAIRTDLGRFVKEVEKYECEPVHTGKVLLYGSSFFRVWGNAAEEQLENLGGYGVLNHGFGGATGDELLYYYTRLVRPYCPKALIVRGGINDIINGYSAKQAAELTYRIAEWSQYDFHGIPVVLLQLFESPCCAKWKESGKFCEMQEYNHLLNEYYQNNPQIYTLNISNLMYDGNEHCGSLLGFRDIFQEDGLHLTEEGYRFIAPLFKQQIEALFGNKLL